MIPQRFATRFAATFAALAMLASGAGAAAQEKAKRPKLSVRPSASMGFVPATITFTAELKEGDNDFADYYCASIEWDWDDGTTAESEDDCEPYEAGKSEIRRRYTRQHKFTAEDVYDVKFRLKQRGKVVGSTALRITVKGGMLP